MKRTGPDSLNSWVISVACCFINMMMYGMARLSGVLFVASVPRFDVNREKASFPYTFASFMRNTSGPLVGFLGHKFGVRAVTTFGSILGATGIGLCYFAEDISIVTLLWGAVFGLGFGLGNILLPVAINQYFDKHRATASGISFSGACLGSFILPPVVEFLLNTYGLSGTYLFLSAFVLNCVPAALLLKKPNFEIRAQKPSDHENGERQSIVSGTKVKLYMVENDYCDSKSNGDTKINSAAVEKNAQVYKSALSYEERMNRLSTQTLLSEYSIRMSTSEPLDVEQIIENSKGRRKVDQEVLEAETLSFTSNNSANSGKDEVFEKDARSSSVQYEQPVTFKNIRRLSSGNIASGKGKDHKKSYENYGYQADLEDSADFKSKAAVRANSVPNNDSLTSQDNEVFFTGSYQKNSENYKYLSDQFKKPLDKTNDYQKGVEWSDTESAKFKPAMLPNHPTSKKEQSKSTLSSFSVIFDPMFILIAITNAIYCFTFVCMITIIVDFARDLEIGRENEKYILMTFSVGDLAGRLGLGWVTDRGYMSTPAFAALCFACQGLTSAAVVWSDGFYSLIILVSLYGLSEAGLIVIFPVIISQYIESDKQTVAIPSSNFLSGPLCLAVAPMIGYFRDDIGSYDYIFYGIGIVSALCCFAWMLAPCIAKLQKKRS